MTITSPFPSGSIFFSLTHIFCQILLIIESKVRLCLRDVGFHFQILSYSSKRIASVNNSCHQCLAKLWNLQKRTMGKNMCQFLRVKYRKTFITIFTSFIKTKKLLIVIRTICCWLHWHNGWIQRQWWGRRWLFFPFVLPYSDPRRCLCKYFLYQNSWHKNLCFIHFFFDYFRNILLDGQLGYPTTIT